MNTYTSAFIGIIFVNLGTSIKFRDYQNQQRLFKRMAFYLHSTLS